ncbi:MAG: hypothetical protein HY080_13545 [Gammaproteobacteria bacterium]|nr:hypothetical protein [Gammaproteobacteria bacterium]
MSTPTSHHPNRARRWLRACYRLFWYSLAVVIIVLATGISLARIYLPDIKSYRSEIESLASSALGRVVQIESMDAKLDGLTPEIIFNGVRMFDQRHQHELLRFDSARVGFDLLRSIRHRKVIPESITISGADLVIWRHKSGVLTVQGYAVDALEKTINDPQEKTDTPQDELSKWFFERSRLVIENSRVLWRDDVLGTKKIQFTQVNIKLRNNDQRHQLTGNLRLPSELGAQLQLAVDLNGDILVPAQWQGEFYAHGQQVHANNWGRQLTLLNLTLHEGLMDFYIWGGWKPQGLASLSGTLSISDVRLTAGHQDKPFVLKLLSGNFDWSQRPQGWQLRVDDFRYQQAEAVWPATAFSLDYQSLPQGMLTVHTSLIKLRDLHNVLNLVKLLDKKSDAILTHMQPHGDLHDLFLQFHPESLTALDFTLSTQFANISAKPWQGVPGITGVNGAVWFDSKRGVVTLDSTKSNWDFNGLFRAPIELDQLHAAASWWRDGLNVYVDVPQLRVGNTDLAAEAGLYAVIPNGPASTYLDMQAHVSKLNAAAAGKYYPVAIMDRSLLQWLDKGIVAGQVDTGAILLQGRLADFPFNNGAGKFVVSFSAHAMELNYKPAWPHLTQLRVDGLFSGTGMALSATQAALFEGTLSNVNATIANFKNPVLQVKGEFTGSTQDAVHFLVDSGIAAQAKDFYAGSKIAGNTTASLSLQVPLVERLEKQYPLDYHGKVSFEDSSLKSFQGKLTVGKLNGELQYSTAGVEASQIRAELFGNPTQLSVATKNIRDSQQISINLRGEMDLHTLLQRLAPSLAADFNGRTPWSGTVNFGYHLDGHPVPGNMSFDTELLGVAVDLPAPLGKLNSDRRYFHVELQFPGDNLLRLGVAVDSSVRAQFLFDTASSAGFGLRKAAINFSGKAVELPSEEVVEIGGRLENFNIDQWKAKLVNPNQGQDRPVGLPRLDLPIHLDMDHFSVHTSSHSADGPAPTPDQMPLINGMIREFIVDDMRLGQLDIAMQRDKDGVRFDKFNLSSDDMTITGSGSWYYRKMKHLTNMRFDLDSPNVGNMLQRLGFTHVIRHGKAQAHLQVNWADSPNRFDFAKLNGSVGVVITDGTIAEVEPGAGRLLGLLSLTELPRHLFLNFKEFSRGMSFDEIRGSFEITNGNAITNDLNINSPAAVVAIRGRTGFAARDYDLEVIAVPRVTSSLTMIGCLLSGGATCGWAFFFDRFMGKKIDDSLAKRYSVKGSWEHPLITETTKKTTPQTNSSGGAE